VPHSHVGNAVLLGQRSLRRKLDRDLALRYPALDVIGDLVVGVAYPERRIRLGVARAGQGRLCRTTSGRAREQLPAGPYEHVKAPTAGSASLHWTTVPVD
jgi:hypothetical protein